MTQAVAQRPDTRDMIIIHRVFRREFGLAPALVRGVAAGDTARAGQVAGHVTEFTTMLHHHHTGEDELVWPRLRDRAELSSALIDRMEAAHAVVERLLGDLDRLLPAWSISADAGSREDLAATLDELHTTLIAHLDEEEREVLPICQEHMTAEEWAELGVRGMAATPKNRRLSILGHILEDATPEERQQFLTHVPAPARLVFKLVGQRAFDKEVAGIRRGATIPRQRSGS
jgi:iron-sulfur cluster repair protein YtfE (RIC family)